MRVYLKVALLLFVIGFVLGAVFSQPLQAALSPLLTDIRTLAAGMKKESFLAMMMTLFLHNLQSSIIMIAGGVVFGILPVLFVLLNGALVGYVIAVTYHATHVNPFLLVLAGVLPHGIFEIPAYLLASAIGLRVGTMLARTLARQTNPADSWKLVGKDLVVTVGLVAGLLFVAAAVETGITPLLLKLVI